MPPPSLILLLLAATVGISSQTCQPRFRDGAAGLVRLSYGLDRRKQEIDVEKIRISAEDKLSSFLREDGCSKGMRGFLRIKKHGQEDSQEDKEVKKILTAKNAEMGIRDPCSKYDVQFVMKSKDRAKETALDLGSIGPYHQTLNETEMKNVKQPKDSYFDERFSPTLKITEITERQATIEWSPFCASTMVIYAGKDHDEPVKVKEINDIFSKTMQGTTLELQPCTEYTIYFTLYMSTNINSPNYYEEDKFLSMKPKEEIIRSSFKNFENASNVLTFDYSEVYNHLSCINQFNFILQKEENGVARKLLSGSNNDAEKQFDLANEIKNAKCSFDVQMNVEYRTNSLGTDELDDPIKIVAFNNHVHKPDQQDHSLEISETKINYHINQCGLEQVEKFLVSLVQVQQEKGSSDTDYEYHRIVYNITVDKSDSSLEKAQFLDAVPNPCLNYSIVLFSQQTGSLRELQSAMIDTPKVNGWAVPVLTLKEKDRHSISLEVEDADCLTEVTCSNADWGNITKQFISTRLEFQVCPWQHPTNDCLAPDNSFSCRVRLVQPVPDGGSSDWSDALEVTIEGGIIENVERTTIENVETTIIENVETTTPSASRGGFVNRIKENDVRMTTSMMTLTTLTTGKEKGAGQDPSSKSKELSSDQQKTTLSPLLLLLLLLQILLLNLFNSSVTP